MKNIEFNDEFEEEPEICDICGGDAKLTGWNEEKELSRFECADCGAIYIYDNEYNQTIVKGEKRDWVQFLNNNLSFPFNGIIDEVQGNPFKEETSPIRYGDAVVVTKIITEDDLYGVIADIQIKKKRFRFPLCDMAAADSKSVNYKIVDNYRTWFANCR